MHKNTNTLEECATATVRITLWSTAAGILQFLITAGTKEHRKHTLKTNRPWQKFDLRGDTGIEVDHTPSGIKLSNGMHGEEKSTAFLQMPKKQKQRVEATPALPNQ